MEKRKNEVIDDYFKNKTKYLSLIKQNNNTAILRAKISKKYIAFTLDCCYRGSTITALKKLLFFKFFKIKPTVFITGIFIKACPTIVKIMKILGLEIMNHSLSHVRFTKINKDEQIKEILENAQAIKEITGIYPKLFRFPYGSYNEKCITLIKKLNMKAIQWDVDTNDWMPKRTDEEIYNTIIKEASNGSIILCHLNGGGFEGIKKAMFFLKKQGYKFVTVSELLELEKSEQ